MDKKAVPVGVENFERIIKTLQVFMIGLVGFLMGRYEIISNNESGYGRYDLAMIPVRSNEKAYLMEFKISKTEKG